MRASDDRRVLLVGATRDRLDVVRTALADQAPRYDVASTTDPAVAFDRAPTVDCVLVEVPLAERSWSLAALRARLWTDTVPVVPFVVDDGPGVDGATLPCDVVRTVHDDAGELVAAIERAVAAPTTPDPLSDALLRATTDALLAVGPDGTVQYATPPFAELVGIDPDSDSDPDAVAGAALVDLLHPDDRATAVERLYAPEDTATPDAPNPDGDERDPVRVRDGDGGWRPVTLERRGVLGDAPQAGLVVRAEPATDAGPAASLAARRRLLEASVDPMYLLAPDGTIRAANDAMAAFVDVDREALVGRHISSFVEVERYEAASALLEERVASNHAAGTVDNGEDGGVADDPVAYEFPVERDGETQWRESLLSPVFVDGEFLETVGIVHDVTERKRREQRLARYETIAEMTPIALFTFDADAVITWTNDVYPERLGIPREDLVGTPFLDLIEQGYYDEAVVDEYLDAVRTLLSSRNDVEQASLEVEVHLPSGETLVQEVYVSLLPLDDGEFRGTIVAFRDITDQRAYERELERQNERLDAFTSVVSHDLRNPIAIADGYLDLALADRDFAYVEEARTAVDRMESLVEQLLTLAREGRAIEAVDAVELERVARDAWAAVDTADATLDVRASTVLLADPGRLQQLFENLFRNCVEHGSTSNRAKPDDSVEYGSTDDGSAVTVTVEPLDGGGFAVADDGPGIPSAERDRVFERGYTTRDGGTGLGLDIVSTIVEAHGWTVRVDESEAGGARFEVRPRS